MYCIKCGNQIGEGAQFCTQCGSAVSGFVSSGAIYAKKLKEIEMFDGDEKSFEILSNTLIVSREICAFNYYRREFYKFAKIKSNDLKSEYIERINNLDTFLTEFPEIYAKHLSPILDMAHKLIISHGIYDLSLEQLTSQHTADFCLCQEDIDITIESFNKTIEANQDRKIRTYNMMPSMVFRGLGGFATALAMNVAVNSIAKADIERANVTSKQRAELFGRIDFDILMERAFIDYWRVFLSLTWQLKQHGVSIWYPTEENNQRATGIYQNLVSGLIPSDKKGELIIAILQSNPYLDGIMEYLVENYPLSDEVKVVQNFFSTNEYA